MSSVASPVTLLINRLAAGPTAPAADGPPLLTRVADVVARMGPGPWARRLIADERNLVTLIASPPGAGNRPHCTGSSTSGGWCWRAACSGS
jgi:hypothetical protein